MMTPQEVSQHAFSKASFGGYNMTQVDAFLDLLTADYTALYKENAVLKSKMKVLVEKVEEYRATEDAMRMTLLSAQKMANAMVAEAEEKKHAAIRDAEAEAGRRMSDLRREIEAEAYRLTAAKTATAAYLARLKELFDQERDFLSKLSDLTPPASAPPDPLETAAAEIEGSVQKLIGEELSPQPENSEDEDLEDTKELDIDDLLDEEAVVREKPQADSRFQIIDLMLDDEERDEKQEPPSAARRVDFNNLQFGKEYELK